MRTLKRRAAFVHGVVFALLVSLVPALADQTYTYEIASQAFDSLATYNAQGARGFRHRTAIPDFWERVSPPKTYFWHTTNALSLDSPTYWKDLFDQMNAESEAGYDFDRGYSIYPNNVAFLSVNHTQGPVWQVALLPIFSSNTLQAMREELASKAGQGYLFWYITDITDGSAGSGIKPINMRIIYRYENPRDVYEVEVDTPSASQFESDIVSRGSRGWRYCAPLQDPSTYYAIGYVFWRRRGSSAPITYHVFQARRDSVSAFAAVANDEGANGFRFIANAPVSDYSDEWLLFGNDSTLGARPGPVINSQPAGSTVAVGAPTYFSVSAYASVGATYQWRKNGTAIPGASNSVYSISSTATGDAGIYDVIISDAGGATVSADASLSLVPAVGPAHITNLSVLTSITAGESFIMGYVVGGAGTTGTKPVLMRAAGPALQNFGVNGYVSDPRLEVFAGSARIGENDDWGGGSGIPSAIKMAGAFPYLDPSSKDSATLLNMPGGNNSVRISASGSASGVVLAEIYDATDQATFGGATPRLINASVLKSIGTSLTLGFVIAGSQTKTVLVRAIGPALAAPPFGLTATAADPRLTLFAGMSKLAENDDWSGAELVSAFSRVGAFPLPAGSKDAALVATLSPGSYSAQVSNATGDGIALVEIYEVP